MNYKKIIKDALDPLKIPLFFQHSTSIVFPYITYSCYNEQGESKADDQQASTGYYVQVDIWSKTGDYDALADQIKSAMIAVEFYDTISQDLYEDNSKIFHKAMRFVCVEEIEMEG
jgi:hypothetical protein